MDNAEWLGIQGGAEGFDPEVVLGQQIAAHDAVHRRHFAPDGLKPRHEFAFRARGDFGRADNQRVHGVRREVLGIDQVQAKNRRDAGFLNQKRVAIPKRRNRQEAKDAIEDVCCPARAR